MRVSSKIAAWVVALAAVVATGTGAARAETGELRVSKGFGLHYMPLYIMEKLKLVEKHAAAAGLGDVKVSYRVIDGGNVINDAMLAGVLDIATGGVPGFLTLWDKTRTIAQLEARGLSGVGGGSVWLVTRNPNIKTLADYTEKDRIAVPGIKTSFVAVVLEMAAAKAFGRENYAKLDPLTVGISHPDALAAMLSGKTEITSHFPSRDQFIRHLRGADHHHVLHHEALLRGQPEALGVLRGGGGRGRAIHRRQQARGGAHLYRSRPGQDQRGRDAAHAQRSRHPFFGGARGRHDLCGLHGRHRHLEAAACRLEGPVLSPGA
jgi:ABC-type nitrate/sulfonate/bicarbonate transport system substrate-binding protein